MCNISMSLRNRKSGNQRVNCQRYPKKVIWNWIAVFHMIAHCGGKVSIAVLIADYQKNP